MVASIEDIKKIAGGSEVELPGFTSESDSFNVMLKRPSIMRLAQEGIIPNALLGTASELFKNGANSAMSSGEKMKELGEVLTTIAKASLINPTYEELEEAGIELTDPQLLYIYNFVQTGVDSLKVFRKVKESQQDTKPVGKTKAQRNPANRR
ncbi:hypothetical protein [Blautia marasmi]|uniref:hypothetical protein n=1 Tax=Blautia marasmi TaxID=1917868 RepID=UPI003511808C